MNSSFITHHVQVPHLAKDETFMLQLTTPELHKEIQTLPPKHICVVLDTSGSMTSTFKYVVKGLNIALDKLRSEDSISVVSYDTEVKLLCEWNKCTDSFKNALKGKLHDLKCRGGTNISGALLKAVEQCMKVKDTVSVIFFTDGLATHGVTDINTLGIMLKRLIPENATMHALGYGKAHNPIFLQKCAEACNNGLYFYIENTDKLHGAFVDIIGKTFELFCQNLKLNLTGENVNFKCLSRAEDFENTSLGDINLNETLKFLFKAKFTKEVPSYNIKYKISGFNVIDVKETEVEGCFEISRGDDNSKDKNVENKVQLLRVSQAVKAAAAAASKRDYKLAESMVRCASDNLVGFPTIRKNLNELVNDFGRGADALQTSSHRLTSYQQDLMKGSTVFSNTPKQIVFGTSPINFFPDDADEFAGPIPTPIMPKAPSSLLNSRTRRNRSGSEPNLPHSSLLSADSTVELTEGDI